MGGSGSDKPQHKETDFNYEKNEAKGLKPQNGFDWIIWMGVAHTFSLSSEQAANLWQSVANDSEKLPRAHVDRLYERMVDEIMAEIIDRGNQAIMAKKLRYVTKVRGADKFEKKFKNFETQVRAEFLNAKARAFFLRSIRFDGVTVSKDNFLQAAQAGGAVAAHGQVAWSLFNRYQTECPPEAEAPQTAQEAQGAKEEAAEASSPLMKLNPDFQGEDRFVRNREKSFISDAAEDTRKLVRSEAVVVTLLGENARLKELLQQQGQLLQEKGITI